MGLGDKDTGGGLYLTAFRVRASLALATVAMILLSPFTINNFLQGRFVLGLGSLTVIVLMAANAWCIGQKRIYQPWLIWGLVPTIAGYLILSFKYQGVVAAFWTYPAIIMFYFMLPEKQGRLANLVFLCLIFPSAKATLSLHLLSCVSIALLAVSVFTAITMRLIYSRQDNLELYALTDPLTGLLNRASLGNVLERALRFRDRTPTPMTLLCLDIDNFKTLNDTYGHDVGDQVLVSLSKVLQGRLRATDHVFRLGGEEFLILLHSCPESDALNIADAIRLSCAQNCSLETRTVTVSIGVASARFDDTWKSWIRRSDQCLYQAKRAGRNRVSNRSESHESGRSVLPVIRSCVAER